MSMKSTTKYWRKKPTSKNVDRIFAHEIRRAPDVVQERAPCQLEELDAERRREFRMAALDDHRAIIALLQKDVELRFHVLSLR